MKPIAWLVGLVISAWVTGAATDRARTVRAIRGMTPSIVAEYTPLCVRCGRRGVPVGWSVGIAFCARIRVMRRLAPLLVVLSALEASCGGVSSPSQNRTSTFSGTVQVGSFGPNHPFSVDKNGEMSVRMTAVSPASVTVLGTQLTQSVSGSCNSLITREPFTGLNRDVLQFPVNKGNYCVTMYDSGGLTQAQNYTIQVSHP